MGALAQNTDWERTVSLGSADETAALGARLAAELKAGDCILLEGPIGAGKTTFARALIQSKLTAQEDVPSPTFTLVQVYDATDFEIWHCDLYRLTSAEELVELGLENAFRDAVALIEWPDRLGDLRPARCIVASFQLGRSDEDRIVTFKGCAERGLSFE